MNCATVTSKIIFAFLGTLLLASGLICMILGTFSIARYYHYYGSIDSTTSSDYIVIASIILIVVGLVLFLAGLSGFYNAFCGDRKGCWWFFMVCLLLVFVLMSTAIVLAFVYRNNLDDSIGQALTSAIDSYYSNPDVKKVVDDIQTSFQCCGVLDASDWLERSRIPMSCPADAWTEDNTGCYEKLKSEFNNHIAFVIGGAVGIMVLILLGIFVSCALICCKTTESKGDTKKEKLYYTLPLEVV